MTKHQFLALAGLIFAVLSFFVTAPLLVVAVICIALGLFTINM